MPQIAPVNDYRSFNTSSTSLRSADTIQCYLVQCICIIETLYFSQHKRLGQRSYTSIWAVMSTYMHGMMDTCPVGGPTGPGKCKTTSNWTTAVLTYTIGAGVTAAAGTRLALQSMLETRVIYLSFQAQDNFAPCYYVLSLPPYVRIG